MKFFWFWLRREWPYALVFGYLGISVILNASFGWTMGIPCLLDALLGRECPGCGLTRAGVCLVQGDFAGAWAANPLWVIVVPLGSWIVVSSVRDAQKAFRHQKMLKGRS
jgi:hypothetical protein